MLVVEFSMGDDPDHMHTVYRITGNRAKPRRL